MDGGGNEGGAFGLYVHWPFCAAKCPYCDFNSHVAARIDHERWRRAYLTEIDRIASETGPRILSTIFFGGGTPSLMEPETVAMVIAHARAAWPTANDLEVTLEANPTSAEADRFAAFRDGGVNRVSLGLQALNDGDLKALGRLHSAEEGLAAYEMARRIFDRVSFDLIYGRQRQTLAGWEAELGEALRRGPDHLSLYQLTIEPGTAFGDRFARGKLGGLPDEDLGADMFAATGRMMEAAGLPAYEISNHARPGAEARHNLIYWTAGDYAGIGPGAHGRLTLDGTRFATETPLSPSDWLRQVEEAGSGEIPRRAIGTRDALIEYLMMGLRLREGIPLSRLGQFADFEDYFSNINSLVDINMVSMADDHLSLTAQGRPLLNAVLREIIR